MVNIVAPISIFIEILRSFFNLKKISITLISLTMMLSLTTAYAWTIKMDFNDGPENLSVQDKGNSYHVFTDAAGNTTYSSCTGIVQDGQCAKMSILKGSDGWGTWGGRVNFTERGVSNLTVGAEVWMSVKVFMPTDFDYTANPRLKFLRLHTRSPSQSNEGYNDLYITPDGGPGTWDGTKNNFAPFIYIKEQQNKNFFVGDENIDRPKLGAWETYEVYLKLDYLSISGGGTSRARIWKNGKLLAELNDIQTLNSAESYAPSFLIFTYWNGGNTSGTGSVPTKNQYLFIDDLTITTDTPSKLDVDGNPMIGDILDQPSPPTNPKVN